MLFVRRHRHMAGPATCCHGRTYVPGSTCAPPKTDLSDKPDNIEAATLRRPMMDCLTHHLRMRQPLRSAESAQHIGERRPCYVWRWCHHIVPSLAMLIAPAWLSAILGQRCPPTPSVPPCLRENQTAGNDTPNCGSSHGATETQRDRASFGSFPTLHAQTAPAAATRRPMPALGQ